MENNFTRMPRVLVVSTDGDAEASAVLTTLSRFGYLVTFAGIGRPSDFLAVLSGEVMSDPDYVVICGHGDNGMLCLPELADEVYYPDEPREITHAVICQYLSLRNTTFISTACTTGNDMIAKEFTAKGNGYVGPCDYVEGDSALYFVQSLFYYLAKPGSTLCSAFENAVKTDSETALFRLFQ